MLHAVFAVLQYFFPSFFWDQLANKKDKRLSKLNPYDVCCRFIASNSALLSTSRTANDNSNNTIILVHTSGITTTESGSVPLCVHNLCVGHCRTSPPCCDNVNRITPTLWRCSIVVLFFVVVAPVTDDPLFHGINLLHLWLACIMDMTDYCQTSRICHWFIFRELKCLILDRWMSCWIDEWVDDRNGVTKNHLQVNGCTFRKEQLDGYSCCSLFNIYWKLSSQLWTVSTTSNSCSWMKRSIVLFQNHYWWGKMKWVEWRGTAAPSIILVVQTRRPCQGKEGDCTWNGVQWFVVSQHSWEDGPCWIELFHLSSEKEDLVSWCCWIVNELRCTHKRMCWYQDTLSLERIAVTVLYSTVWKLSPQTSRGWKPTT